MKSEAEKKNARDELDLDLDEVRNFECGRKLFVTNTI